jgi:tRNA pseudouridine38-40 synthase
MYQDEGVNPVRLRLDVAYDGTDFSGWATQPGRRTVQGELELAIQRVLRLDSVSITCAGRTDAGVHALGQVCHVDLPVPADPEQLRLRLASALAADVRVRDVSVAPADFDARFSAVWRRYVYRSTDDPAAADPLERHHVLAWKHRLDVDAMNAASELLLGEHDFAAFCRRRDGATTIRTLLRLESGRTATGLIKTTVVADAFCHSMVRAVMGALLAVGEGRLPHDEPTRILAGRRRDPRITVLPPHGLTLEQVGYPPPERLAERAETARSLRTLVGSQE